MSTSLPVLQFMFLATGQWQVQAPANRKRTLSITTLHGVCLNCHAVTDKDLITFEDGDELSICRACFGKVLNGVPVQQKRSD